MVFTCTIHQQITRSLDHIGRNATELMQVVDFIGLMQVFHQGPVVQSWVSANPGLKFNPLFSFLYFYPSVSSQTLGTKTSIDIEKISEEIFPGL